MEKSVWGYVRGCSSLRRSQPILKRARGRGDRADTLQEDPRYEAPGLADVGIAIPSAAFSFHKEGKEERGNIDSWRLILNQGVAAFSEALKRCRKEHPRLSQRVVLLCLFHFSKGSPCLAASCLS